MKYGYHPKLAETTQVPFIVNTLEIPSKGTVKLLFNGTKSFHMHGILYVDANVENAGLYLLSTKHIFKVYESSYESTSSIKIDQSSTPVINLEDYSVTFTVPAWSNIVFISFTDKFSKIDFAPSS